MARFTERFPYASTSGEPPNILLSEQDWQGLEEAIRAPVLLGGRSEYQEICNRYLSNAVLEKAAVRVSDVQRIASQVTASLAPFFALAYGQNPAKSADVAAWNEFSTQFEDVLSDFAVPAPHGGLDLDDEEVEPQIVPLTLGLLAEVAIRVQATLAKISSAGGSHPVFEGSEGIQPGWAFAKFLLEARAWAKAHKLPYGAMRSVDDTAAPFAEFLFVSVKLMPEDLTLGIKTASAVAERLKSVSKSKGGRGANRTKD